MQVIGSRSAIRRAERCAVRSSVDNLLRRSKSSRARIAAHARQLAPGLAMPIRALYSDPDTAYNHRPRHEWHSHSNQIGRRTLCRRFFSTSTIYVSKLIISPPAPSPRCAFLPSSVSARKSNHIHRLNTSSISSTNTVRSWNSYTSRRTDTRSSQVKRPRVSRTMAA